MPVDRSFVARRADRQERDGALAELTGRVEVLLAPLEDLVGRYPDDEAGRAQWAAEVHALLTRPVDQAA